MARKSDERTIDQSEPTKIESKDRVESEEECDAAADEEIPHITFPDGGLRAWMVVFGVACGTCGTFGFVNAWGVFQAYYEETLLPDTSPSTIAWIGSIQYALVFMPGLVLGRLFDMGYFKLPLLVSSCILVAAAFLVAECKEFWQFLLCQGIAVGLASGSIFGPIMGILAHWFEKRINLAYASMSLGSSVGGTVFPIAVRNLIEHVGFKWTMRIMGFIILMLLGICNLVSHRRLPPNNKSGSFINLAAFRFMPYTLYTVAALVNWLGLYTVLTYIDVSAAQAGVPQTFSFYLLPIANAGSAFGRLSGGIIADHIGQLNVMIPATLIAGVMTYVWPAAKSVGANVAVALLYGMSSGVYASLVATPIVAMGERHDVGQRIGMAFMLLAMGALAGPPISGAIYDSTGTYKWVGIYAGTTVEIGVILMLMSRYLLAKDSGGMFAKL
ncbi:MFS general substrate transporter [Sparassis latifolia]